MGVGTSFFNCEDRNAALCAKAKSDSKVKSGAPNSKPEARLSFGLCAILKDMRRPMPDSDQ